MTFKALTRKLPNYLVKLFTKCDSENYNLQGNNVKFSLLKPKTHFLKRSFSYTVIYVFIIVCIQLARLVVLCLLIYKFMYIVSCTSCVMFICSNSSHTHICSNLSHTHICSNSCHTYLQPLVSHIYLQKLVLHTYLQQLISHIFAATFVIHLFAATHIIYTNLQQLI